GRLRTAGGGPAGPGAYAVRIDKLSVRPADAALPEDETGVEVIYVTSEYAGSTMMHFFRHAGGRVIEVEHHLSHREPETFDPGASYRLSWGVGDGRVLPLA
ncbi:MAG: TOBE domain-containing protein, partial [Alphaproteobacteria bacterium]